MRTYTCASCKVYFTEADKQWDIAIAFGKCPDCLEPLHDFPVTLPSQKPKLKAQQLTAPTIHAPPRQPYPWGAIFTWTVTAFLLVLSVPSSANHPEIDQKLSALLRLLNATFIAVLTGLTVGVYKYFHRDPWRFSRSTLDPQSADKAAFWLAMLAAVIFAVQSIYLQSYASLIEAGLCVAFGFGVKFGIASLRWLLAAYAFLSPIIVVVSTASRSGGLWPFLFFAASRSIVTRQNQIPAIAIAVGTASQTEISTAKVNQQSQRHEAITGQPDTTDHSSMSWNEEAAIRCLLRFACPQRWSRLTETGSPERRHCKECNQDVYLVHDEEEFARHAAQGHCVAVPIEGDGSFLTDDDVVMGSPTQGDIVELK